MPRPAKAPKHADRKTLPAPTLQSRLEHFGRPLTESERFPHVVGLVALLLAWLLLRPRRRRGALFNKVPGGLPFIGLGHKLGRMENLVRQFETWLDAHGGDDGICECDIAGMRYIIVGGHQAMLELMRHRPDRARRAKSFGPMVRDGIDGLITAEGKNWRAQRRVVSPAFSHGKMEGYLPAMKTVGKRLVRKWQAGPGVQRGEGTVAGQPIIEDLACIAADVISLTAFTYDFNSLGSPVRAYNPIPSPLPSALPVPVNPSLLRISRVLRRTSFRSLPSPTTSTR